MVVYWYCTFVLFSSFIFLLLSGGWNEIPWLIGLKMRLLIFHTAHVQKILLGRSENLHLQYTSTSFLLQQESNILEVSNQQHLFDRQQIAWGYDEGFFAGGRCSGKGLHVDQALMEMCVWVELGQPWRFIGHMKCSAHIFGFSNSSIKVGLLLLSRLKFASCHEFKQLPQEWVPSKNEHTTLLCWFYRILFFSLFIWSRLIAWMWMSRLYSICTLPDNGISKISITPKKLVDSGHLRSSQVDLMPTCSQVLWSNVGRNYQGYKLVAAWPRGQVSKEVGNLWGDGNWTGQTCLQKKSEDQWVW